MRPSGSTAAASVKTSRAPPVAILPRCTKCQSSAMPSRAEYWHIGEMTTRFFRVTPRRVIGENSRGWDAIEILLTGRLRNEENANLGTARDHVRNPCGIRLIRSGIKSDAAYARDTGEGVCRGCGHDRAFPPARH